MKTRRVYSSKIGMVWVVLAMACVFTLLIGRMLVAQDPAVGRAIMALSMTVASVFVLVAIPCRYTFAEDSLRIQSGCIVKVVPYTEIIEASPIRDWRWAPALSPDRILLRCRHGELRVSPVRQQEFLIDLRLRLEPSAHRSLNRPIV